MKKLLTASLALVAVGAAACKENNAAAPASQLAVSMASTFSTTPAGYANLTTSYDASGSAGAFEPEFDDHDGRGHDGFGLFGRGPGFGIGFMGGGLAGAFLGDGFGGFHPDRNCTFSTSTGTTCTDSTRSGLVATRIAKYTTASGTVEQHIDSLTDAVATSTTVAGTVTRRDSVTSVIAESSNQNVTGLLRSSTQLTINSASKASENTTGTSPQGAFTSERVTADTINGLILPKSSTSHFFPIPTAGTVIRAMSAKVTITGQAAANSSRREVITYTGSDTAKVVITQDGTTQNCTLPLPHGHLTCS